MLIDTHIHWCVFGRPMGEVVADFEQIEAGGFDAVVVLPLPAMGAPPDRAVGLIPGAYRDLTGIDEARIIHDDLEAWLEFEPLWSARPRKLQVLSFLDVRAWDGRSELDAWWGQGHAGLKNILILEEDADKMRMPPLHRVPAVGVDQYLEAHREVFAAAARWDVPLLYHADLSNHAAFVEECLQAHPSLRVVIPHFGFSRRRLARLFERFPGVMTDISSLKPYIDSDPEAYRSFIEEYPNRVMLGSDAIACNDLSPVLHYVDSVRKLGLTEKTETAVLGENARRFLGRALREAEGGAEPA